MSGQLESALVLSLVDSIKWESALGPVDETGVLTTVDPALPLDITNYARRDRELAYRDLINAAAVLKVSLEVETVFNTTPIRPKVEGLTTDIMPPTQGDLGLVNSQVVHVKNSSLPIDALAADKDLAGRDALLYEVLARACQVFSTPPLTPNDANGTLVPNTTAWSLAEGASGRRDVNPAWPLEKNLFKMPDKNLAERDNQIAAYVSRLCQILKNPFEFAERLYVRVDNVNDRELEIYALIRTPFVVGTTYVQDDEVYYGTSWWRAEQYTTETPGLSSDWTAITGPTERIYQADPNLLGRNRIVYNTSMKTLKWISESLTSVHTPQIFALSIPGPEIGQFVTTVPAIPEAKDAEFWRQKAGRIIYEGTLATHLDGYHDTTVVQTGVTQSDTTGLTGPGQLTFPFTASLESGAKYRFTALVKPSQDVTILGSYNTVGMSGTLNGVTFTGDYAPSTGVAGLPIPYTIALPQGGWELTLQYTDLEASTDGFGTKITNNGVTIMEDAAPLLFQSQNGLKYPLGTLLDSNPVIFTSSGGNNTFNIQWTYGDGQFHIRSLTFTCRDRKVGRYSMRVNVTTGGGVSLISDIGTLIPTIDTYGERDIYNVMPFEFIPTAATNPNVVMKWLPEGDELPLQVRQVQLEQVLSLDPVPEFGGFLAWKQECLYRAMRAVSTAYASFVSKTEDDEMPDFTLDGTLWDKTSTEAWMQAIETYQPRLRNIPSVTEIISGRHYQVVGGYAVYNGGTYSSGQKFWGTDSTGVLTYGGRVDQQGAFILSYPGHVGKPALLPLGLWYNNSDVVQANETSRQSPVLTVCQPWMVDAGIYVAHPDFWSPDTITTDLEIEAPPPDRYPDTMPMVPGFREGQYDPVVYSEASAVTMLVWSGSLADTLYAVSGGTMAGTMSIQMLEGTLTDVVEEVSGGTMAGTVGIEVWTGSLASVVEITSGGTMAGTVGIEVWSGSLAVISVSGGDYTEYGTIAVGFYAGAYTLI